MARYIAIDRQTGQIVGDTYAFDPSNTAYDNPYTACRDIDDERGIRNMVYTEHARLRENGEVGYYVFCATDEDGRMLLPPITNPTDPAQIEAVWKNCRSPDGVRFIDEDE